MNSLLRWIGLLLCGAGGAAAAVGLAHRLVPERPATAAAALVPAATAQGSVSVVLDGSQAPDAGCEIPAASTVAEPPIPAPSPAVNVRLLPLAEHNDQSPDVEPSLRRLAVPSPNEAASPREDASPPQEVVSPRASEPEAATLTVRPRRGAQRVAVKVSEAEEEPEVPEGGVSEASEKLAPRRIEPQPAVAQQAAPQPPSNTAATLDLLMKMLQERQKSDPARPAAAAQGATAPAASEPLPAPKTAEIRPAPRTGEGDDKLEMTFHKNDLREVLQLLSAQSGLNILASPNVQGTVSGVLREVNVQQALEAILKSTGHVARREGNFVFVGTTADFAALDRNSDQVGTRVYRPNYVSARELQGLLTPLLSDHGKARIAVSSAAQVGIPSDATSAGGDSFSQNDTLVVQDYETILCQLDEIVREVDQRPLQVAIEAMILSVKLSDEFKLGVDWQLLRSQNHVRLGIGQPRITPLNGSGITDANTGGTTGEFQFTQPGLTFAFLDSNLGAFIKAVETIGDVNIIATPRLMCLNKQRAEIHIGAQLGYRTSTTTETATTEAIEFLEVGTQLRIRPFIARDGQIRVEIHPELSTGLVKDDGLPEKTVTQVTGNVMVPDGQSFVIGGLIREDLTTSGSQVPLLGSLPGIGPFFRQKTEKTDRQEILVIVTPRIVCNPQMAAEGDEAATEFHQRQGLYADKMSPLGKRNLARTYFRRAQAAWADGNRAAALRNVNLSLHIDPMNRAAMELRNDIWEGVPAGEHSGAYDVRPPGPPPGGLDGEVIEPPQVPDGFVLPQGSVPPASNSPQAAASRKARS